MGKLGRPQGVEAFPFFACVSVGRTSAVGVNHFVLYSGAGGRREPGWGVSCSVMAATGTASCVSRWGRGGDGGCAGWNSVEIASAGSLAGAPIRSISDRGVASSSTSGVRRRLCSRTSIVLKPTVRRSRLLSPAPTRTSRAPI